MKKRVKKGLSLVLAAVCLVSGTLLAKNVLSYRAGSEAYDDARSLAAAAPPVTGTAPTLPAVTVPQETKTVWVPAPIDEEDVHVQDLMDMDVAALRQENADVLGWIRIPDTPVDYPLLQGEDNDFYLNNNWRGVKNYVGSIFLEHRNSPDLMDYNTIIYGHNMGDGSMFGSLYRFRWDAYWKEHPYVYILSDAGVLRYEVFSTYTAEVGSATYGLSFRQMETRADFLTMALDNSEIDTGIHPEVTDLILTLSTCSGTGYSTRRVIHARLPMVEVELQ